MIVSRITKLGNNSLFLAVNKNTTWHLITHSCKKIVIVLEDSIKFIDLDDSVVIVRYIIVGSCITILM